MDLGHISTFLWAIITNWATWLTGGLIMALIFLWQTFSKKWQPPKWLLKRCCWLFLAYAVFQAWDEQYTSATKAQKALDDKSPKLDGMIHRYLVAEENGATNSLIFAEISINNSGGAPSLAEAFHLKVLLPKHAFSNAEAINIPDEYKLPFLHNGKPWLLDLKRRQLISEKTIKAIPVGESQRGWVAFRLHGAPVKPFQPTNVVLSFADVAGTEVFVTNGFWKGKRLDHQALEDLTAVIPGAENIFYPVEPPARTTWLPPELPPGCSNVVVFFGTEGRILSREIAEISTAGKRFAISELPDFLFKDLDKLPNYSPRQREMWVRAVSTKFTVGEKMVDYPIQPVIISNRL